MRCALLYPGVYTGWVVLSLTVSNLTKPVSTHLPSFSKIRSQPPGLLLLHWHILRPILFAYYLYHPQDWKAHVGRKWDFSSFPGSNTTPSTQKAFNESCWRINKPVMWPQQLKYVCTSEVLPKRAFCNNKNVQCLCCPVQYPLVVCGYWALEIQQCDWIFNFT